MDKWTKLKKWTNCKNGQIVRSEKNWTMDQIEKKIEKNGPN